MLSRADLPYQSCYCEENIWRLCERPDTLSHVALISSPATAVAIWQQRAGREPDGLVVWDYHVVGFDLASDHLLDFDTRLPFPSPIRDWLASSFPWGDQVPADHRPWFRVMRAETYARTLSSDRRHMRDAQGGWLQPPPSWPAPVRGPSNLMQWIDMTSDGGEGQIMGLAGLRKFLST